MKNSYGITPWCFSLKQCNLGTAVRVCEIYRYAILKCKSASLAFDELVKR